MVLALSTCLLQLIVLRSVKVKKTKLVSSAFFEGALHMVSLRWNLTVGQNLHFTISVQIWVTLEISIDMFPRYWYQIGFRNDLCIWGMGNAFFLMAALRDIMFDNTRHPPLQAYSLCWPLRDYCDCSLLCEASLRLLGCIMLWCSTMLPPVFKMKQFAQTLLYSCAIWS